MVEPIIIGVVIAAAALFLLRRWLKLRKGSAGCGCGCECGQACDNAQKQRNRDQAD